MWPRARCFSSGASRRGAGGVLQDRPQARRYRLDRKPTSSLWPAPNRQGMTTGPCEAGGGVGVGALPIPRDGAAHLKKLPQAVAEAGVVHPQGERRVRGPHGARAGCTPNPMTRGGRWSARGDPVVGYPSPAASPAGETRRLVPPGGHSTSETDGRLAPRALRSGAPWLTGRTASLYETRVAKRLEFHLVDGGNPRPSSRNEPSGGTKALVTERAARWLNTQDARGPSIP